MSSYYSQSADFFLKVGFDMKESEIKARRTDTLTKLTEVQESIKTALVRYNELKHKLLDAESARKEIEKKTDTIIKHEVDNFYKFESTYTMTDNALMYKLKCDAFNTICMQFNASRVTLAQLQSIMHKLDNDVCTINLQLMDLKRIRLQMKHITEMDTTPIAMVAKVGETELATLALPSAPEHTSSLEPVVDTTGQREKKLSTNKQN